MKNAVARAWLSFFLLAVALLLLAMTFPLNPTARLVPVWVAVVAVGLLSIQACLDLFPGLFRNVSRFERLRLRKVETLRGRVSAPDPPDREPLGRVLAWFTAAPLLIALLGFTLATPLYTVAFLRFRAGESWASSIAVGAGVTIVISLLLSLAVGRPVIDGVLTGWALAP